MSTSSVAQTVVLISGANAGIGFAATRRLSAEHNHSVVIGSRSPAAAEEAAASIKSDSATADVSSLHLGLESDFSVTSMKEAMSSRNGRLDDLINNAGTLLDLADPKLPTREFFTQTFLTNVIGTTCLTEACLPLLRKSSLPRVVFVSSNMGNLKEALNDKMPFFDWDIQAYDSSKAELNMLALNYKSLLSDGGGLVHVVCPGLVNTKLSGKHPDGDSPEVGATRIVELATAGAGGVNGTFSDKKSEVAW